MKSIMKFVGLIALLSVLVMSTASAFGIPKIGENLKNVGERLPANATVLPKTPSQTLLNVKEVSGVVFAPSKYAKSFVEDVLKDVNLPDFLKGRVFKIYILLSQNDRAILLSEQSIPTSNARFEGCRN